MGKDSGIAWTHATFNPWWGCTKVSAGCARCYAESFDRRMGGRHWGDQAERRFFGQGHWNDPVRWNKKAEQTGEPLRVFAASMADVFEDRRDLDAERLRLFELIESTPALTWIIVTKRPEHARQMPPDDWRRRGWPRNVWLLASVEDQENADRRVPELLAVPARIRGLSLEPLLGPVDLRRGVYQGRHGKAAGTTLSGIHWLVVGGESGRKARPFDLAWARSLRDQGRAAGCAVFVKQLGAKPVGLRDEPDPAHAVTIDRGRRHVLARCASCGPVGGGSAIGNVAGWSYAEASAKEAAEQHPRKLHLRHPKGEDPNEWPADLRVREYPDGQR